MTVVGYHDPPDWDYKKIEEDGGQNWSTQLLGVLYILIGPFLLMNLLLAITVNITKNLRMRGKFLQTKIRVKDFFRYAFWLMAFRKICPGFVLMKEFTRHNRMVNKLAIQIQNPIFL